MSSIWLDNDILENSLMHYVWFVIIMINTVCLIQTVVKKIKRKFSPNYRSVESSMVW